MRLLPRCWRLAVRHDRLGRRAGRPAHAAAALGLDRGGGCAGLGGGLGGDAMSGQRRANWRAEAEGIGRDVEDRLMRRIEALEMRVEALALAQDGKLLSLVDVQSNLRRLRFSLLGLAISLLLVIVAVAVSR